MPKQLTNMPAKRYQQTNVIEHLASQYVLGTLTAKVHQRVEHLALSNKALEQRILYWQSRFVELDQQTPELPVSEGNWQSITQALDLTEDGVSSAPALTSHQKQDVHHSASSFIQQMLDNVINWIKVPKVQLASGFSVVIFAFIALFFNPLAQKSAPLSYVAVLTQQSGQAHLVASTYGESKKLVVNIINAPKIDNEQDLELWVVSKTDGQARSLGIMPLDTTVIEQQLSEAQWRLIKDSASLIVTLEENGGSAIGEPSELVISKGLCIRLQEWQKNA